MCYRKVCLLHHVFTENCVRFIKYSIWNGSEREREREREEEGPSEEEKESEERGRRGKGKASCPSGMDVAPELTEFSPNFKAPVLAGYQLLATTSPGRLSKY
jgi:hypothetical protein